MLQWNLTNSMYIASDQHTLQHLISLQWNPSCNSSSHIFFSCNVPNLDWPCGNLQVGPLLVLILLYVFSCHIHGIDLTTAALSLCITIILDLQGALQWLPLDNTMRALHHNAPSGQQDSCLVLMGCCKDSGWTITKGTF